jgi:proline dehydrogenase
MIDTLSKSLFHVLAASDGLKRLASTYGMRKPSSFARRFIAGESVHEAIDAARAVQARGMLVTLDLLGESVTSPTEATSATRAYQQAMEDIIDAGVERNLSIKLTQLGLDIDPHRCYEHVRRLVERALPEGNVVWIDMEQYTYVDATLDLYRRVLAEFPNVGVCLQAYLYRTEADLASLVPLGGGVRLVKGAYLEPTSIAYPKKADVDANYLKLAQQMIAPEARAARFRAVFGTHDGRLIRAIQERAASMGVPREGLEFALLYGIQRGEQTRLARERARIRVLVAYGDYWFPWYMRRLAERPANVVFVAKSMFSGNR